MSVLLMPEKFKGSSSFIACLIVTQRWRRDWRGCRIWASLKSSQAFRGCPALVKGEEGGGLAVEEGQKQQQQQQQSPHTGETYNTWDRVRNCSPVDRRRFDKKLKKDTSFNRCLLEFNPLLTLGQMPKIPSLPQSNQSHPPLLFFFKQAQWHSELGAKQKQQGF